ncbi:MAG: Hpt domain-containing protein [Gemmatimonadota bacterium]
MTDDNEGRSPALDAEALERLKEWGGDGLVQKMASLFVENAPARLTQIRTAVETGVAEEAERGAHSLKSSAANLGAMRLRNVVATMEEQASKGDLDAVKDALALLETEYLAAMEALEAVAAGVHGQTGNHGGGS